jgi:hypothetical protein
MAYAFVQRGSVVGSNVVTWAQATGAGNLLVLCFVKATNSGEYVASLAGNVNTSQPGWASAVGTINTSGCKIATGSGNANFSTATLLYLPGGSNSGGDTTTTLTLVADAGGNTFVGAMEFSGIASSSPFINYNFGAQTNPGTGTDAVTSGNVNVSTVPALLAGFGYSLAEAVGAGWTGTGFAGRIVDPGTAYIWGEDKRVTSSGNVAATFTNSAGAADTNLAFGMAFAEPATPAVYDGTTASGTVVSTGTGGTALPAFNVGDCIHVLLMAQTASALTITSNPSDGHNTYVNLQNADNHGTTGFIWARWTTMVTTAITTPVISATWSGTAKLAIAVAKLSNINTGAPNVTGGNAQSNQTTPSGSNAQTSGLTISPNLLVPVTLGGWGFSVNESGAPAAGAGFSQIGTAWAALGSACLTYETMTSNAAIQQTATFTPIGGTNTFTALDVFNQIGSHPPTVPASGPMPRQIYVMP